MANCKECNYKNHCGGFRDKNGRCPEGMVGQVGRWSKMNMFWVVFIKKVRGQVKTKAQILAMENVEKANAWAKEKLASNKYESYQVKPYA